MYYIGPSIHSSMPAYSSPSYTEQFKQVLAKSALLKTTLLLGVATVAAGAITTIVGFEEESERTRNAGFITSGIGLAVTGGGAILTYVAMKALYKFPLPKANYTRELETPILSLQE